MENTGNSKFKWVQVGLVWGMFMFLTLKIIIPLLEGEHLEMSSLMKSLAAWIIMGLAFGYVSKLIKHREG